MADARFEDGNEKPLRLRAQSAEDLPVLAALLQDAVFTAADVKWQPKSRRFDLLLNRFRWEDADHARRENRAFERVRTVLTIRDVQKVASQGLKPGNADLVLSLLTVTFTPTEDGAGYLDLTLAGDEALRLSVECLDLTLSDVTRPYRAPSGRAPEHKDL
ncbi:DUF2948 family protein [Falsigemmobacter intermedius]|uniref:DUF2948 family protein n=1 Tax=Falsigemmobacter intermedius TaxID=1553448 RepID=A0A3S4XRS6_9RHOB|nr:DUF2948 family protein [Falsigemmobacter intermedius]RWY41075.1 DUF2948 family protein [Falsigemmobacter intermedius]